jgi:hypothetical protein
MLICGVAEKPMTAQILPNRLVALAVVLTAILAGGCGLDADEETSTATTPPTITGGATGPSGPSGPMGPTGPTGEKGADEDEPQGAGLGTDEPEPAT